MRIFILALSELFDSDLNAIRELRKAITTALVDFGLDPETKDLSLLVETQMLDYKSELGEDWHVRVLLFSTSILYRMEISDEDHKSFMDLSSQYLEYYLSIYKDTLTLLRK